MSVLSMLAYGLALVGISYQVAVLLARLVWRRGQTRRKTGLSNIPAPSPVTILKPLSGDEPRLYDSLSSFCHQNHPRYQLIFGVQRADDPALATIAHLQRDFPHIDIHVVIDSREHGSNGKVNNLINMLAAASHDVVVVADSDIIVGPAYLETVIAPLRNPAVGIVTCAYFGRPAPGIWSHLGALYINDWFYPSVLLAHTLGSREFAFGASIALRREALDAIGGFSALVDHLADDYWLGELTRRRGLTTVLSHYEVQTHVHEPTFANLWRHEVRWLSTIRTLHPINYALSLPTHALVLTLLAVALSGGRYGLWLLLGLSLIARLVLHYSVNKARWIDIQPRPWLIPLRDLLTFFEWGVGLGARRVHWRRQKLHIKTDGSLRKRSGDSL